MTTKEPTLEKFPELKNTHGGADLLMQILARNVAEMSTDLTYVVHVLAEAKIVPGITTACRCEACRKVANDLDCAEYMQAVPESERWWKQ